MPWRLRLLGVAGALSLVWTGAAAARTDGGSAVNGPIVVGAMWPIAPRAALMTADLDGGHARDLGIGAAPSFSPDGKRIAYVGFDERGLAIWVMGADGSGRR